MQSIDGVENYLSHTLLDKERINNMLNNFSSRSFFTLLASTLTLLTVPTTAIAGILYDESVAGTPDLSNLGSEPTFVGTLNKGSNTLNATFNSATPDYFTIEIPEGLALTNIALNSWQAFDPSGASTFEDIAFFAIKRGNTFDFDLPPASDEKNRAVGLFGWSHLRTTQLLDTQVGDTLVKAEDKILREMGLSRTSPLDNGIADLYNAEADSNPYDAVPELTMDEITALEDSLEGLSGNWESGAEGFPLPLKSGIYSFWLRQGSDTLIEVDLDFQTASTPEPSSIIALATVVGLGIKLKKQKLDY